MRSKGTVVIGMSGGVDSSVAALSLKKQGYNVIAVFLRNYPDDQPYLDSICPFKGDKAIAEEICAKNKIPFSVLDYRQTYLKEVIEPMFADYQSGLTPNPDTYCNKIVKFPALWGYAKKIKADYIATGHYARIRKTKSGFQLLTGKDKTKDQSYFLYQLTQSDLSRTLFPNGNLTKKEIRKMAKSLNLPNWNKQSSRGICFIGQLPFKSFLHKKIESKPGNVLSPEGKIIGTHPGIFYYTIGEKIGPNIGIIIKKPKGKEQKRWYVASKNTERNEITAAPESHPLLKRKEISIIKFHLINPEDKMPKQLRARIRHLGKFHSGTLKNINHNYYFTFNKPLEGLAPGQAIVLYHKNQVIGGGEISF